MKTWTIRWWLITAAWWAMAASSWAELRVATLHPVLSDVARQVGGERVAVLGLMAPGADVHHFSPTPGDVKKLAGVSVILASGKGLENYLEKLRSNLKPEQTLVEVGRTIPSIKIEASDATFMCCPEHAHGAIDPHWWNSVENMQRAARVVAGAFSEKDPAGAAIYKAQANAWAARLDGLKRWAKTEFRAIPSGSRKLATAHLSLSYFAKEYGFKLVPVQGLSHEVKATSKELAHALQTIRQHGITTIFPESGVNPKYLRQLASEAGVNVGGELVGDANGAGSLAGFEAAFRHNVALIVKGLSLGGATKG
jgi:zinc/manganese transport system substrate-binding protein